MKRVVIATAFLTLFLAHGCKQRETASTESTTTQPAVTAAALTPEQLGEIGAQIRKNPNDAPQILSAHGLTQDAFTQQVRQVAQDPAASKRYAAAYKKAGA